MNLSESNRVSEGLDIWVVEGFAQEKLNCDPAVRGGLTQSFRGFWS